MEKQSKIEEVKARGKGLKRQIKTRDVIMIGVGGTLGTGIFLSSGYVLSQVGPGGCILAYLLGGFVMWAVMTCLGELSAAMPVSGGVQAFATEYINPAMGFTVGWINWLSGALTVTAQIVASAIIAHNLVPGVSQGIWCIIFAALLIGINFMNGRHFGNASFWFATLKLLLVAAFVIMGLGMIFGFVGTETYGLANYTQNGGLFPKGIGAIGAVLLTALYAYGGSELFASSCGEIEDEKEIPKAVNSTIFILIGTYVVIMMVLIALLPWTEADLEGSPFAYVFELAGIKSAAIIVNIIVLTSALSSGNYFVYGATRYLWSIAKYGQAPKFLAKVDKRGVPINALIASMIFAMFAIVANFVAASTVYLFLMILISSSNVIIDGCVCLSHIGFRRRYMAEGGNLNDLKYKSPLFPLFPVMGLVVYAAILIMSLVDKAQTFSIIFSLLICVVMYISFSFYCKKKGGIKAIIVSEEDLQ